MDRIERIVAKYLSPTLNEQSGDNNGQGSTEMWFGAWNRQPIIYVRDEVILWSPLPEFPTGSEMSNETRQRAIARGYTVLDW